MLPSSQSGLSRIGLAAILFSFSACSPASQSLDPPAPETMVRLNLPDMAIPAEDTLSPAPPVLPKSVAEEQSRFLLPPGYRIEPVLTEPAIKEPAAIAFDGNGRLFVLELRTYMQDADATDELAPTSRISMHEDLDNDGVYESHSVFVDSLVFPRFVTPFGRNSILSMESNEDEVYRFTDTDGDGQADTKTLFTTNYGKAGNVEHQQAFMYTGMDNWMYSTYNAFRVRWTPDGMLRESTGSNRSQWGVTQDNEGVIWFQGGASGHPGYFQFPVHYGNFNLEEPYEAGFEIPYGVAGVGDYQPGPQASRTDGTLNQVTGAAGNDVFRGHRLPEDLIGHYIYGEPVARIVRRVESVVTEGIPQLRNVYQADSSEFIRSTDPLFRPVDMATAPDGSLFIVDMYRGIIQEGNWTRPGSFLRAKIDQYQLDKPVSRGRIWRVTYDGIDRDTRQPRMHEEGPAEWVEHLTHPNGWWRDAAQQLLVLEQDASVAPALIAMAQSHPFQLARFHALWTLEGLNELDLDLATALLNDADPRMRIQAIRASETLYKAGAVSLISPYRVLTQDPDPAVAIQALMTLNLFGPADLESIVTEAKRATASPGVHGIADEILQKLTASSEDSYWISQLPEDRAALYQQGEQIYNDLCSQCHGPSGRGTPLGNGQYMAPSLVQSPRVLEHRHYLIKTLLHGLAGPIDGREYPGNLMVGMGEQDNTWIAAAASYVRNSFTNRAGFVTPEEVSALREALHDRSIPWTQEEMRTRVPQLVPNPQDWAGSSSHNSSLASNAFNFAGWESGAPQIEGMWFQIDLPANTVLTEMQFDSNAERRGEWPDATFHSTHPSQFVLEISEDGLNWISPLLVEHAITRDANLITFSPTKGRHLRMRLTGPSVEGSGLRIRALRLFHQIASD